jgi:hypothetical protein
MLWVRLKKSLGVLPVPRTRSMRRWLGVERNSLVGMVLVQKQGFRERWTVSCILRESKAGNLDACNTAKV